MSKNKSSKYRKSYQEEANEEYPDKEFKWESIDYKDWIIEKGIRKYRTKWKPSRFNHDYYKSPRLQRFLEYFKEDIADEIPSEKGIKIIWKDSYIAVEDITAD